MGCDTIGIDLVFLSNLFMLNTFDHCLSFFFYYLGPINLFVFRYNLVFFLVTYLLPMVGMILCYLQMGLHLWQGDRETIGSVPQHPAMVKSRQNKKRVSNSGAHESNF